MGRAAVAMPATSAVCSTTRPAVGSDAGVISVLGPLSEEFRRNFVKRSFRIACLMADDLLSRAFSGAAATWASRLCRNCQAASNGDG